MPARPAVGDPALAVASTNPTPLGAGSFHDVFWFPLAAVAVTTG